MELLIWAGIAFCLSQSAMFSGMNLGLFSLSKLELEVEAKKGSHQAEKVLHLRKDANLMLVTILWGNVGVNVLLAMLSDSVLAGVMAFVFSTVVITVFAEIIPQAWFSRNALKMAALLSPVLRFYQVLLYPVAKPSAMVLDAWLGGEEIRYFKEKDLRKLIRLHMEAASSEISEMEGQGVLNFLAIDDLPLSEEGELIEPASVLRLPFNGKWPQFPLITAQLDDSFLQLIHQSGKSWVVLVDEQGEPGMVLNSDNFIRDAIFNHQAFNPFSHCHRPIIVRDAAMGLGEAIQRYRVKPEKDEDDIVDDDVILLWGEQPRIITGTDILGRLLRGIVHRQQP